MRERCLFLGLFTLLFTVVYASANWLTSLHTYRWPMGPSRWPFWPQAAPLYLSLNLLIPWTFCKIEQRELPLLGTALLGTTLLAWPCFVLFPLAALQPPDGVVLNPLYKVADVMNLAENYFPSLHVALAVTCALCLRSGWVFGWAMLIAGSTLVLHQHYLVDLLGGAAVASLVVWWARGPGRVDAVCLGELVRCSVRHRRYALVAIGLVVGSLPAWRRRRVARVGFCYLQRLDDLLDGHLAAPGGVEPLEIATQQQQIWRSEAEFDNGRLGILGRQLMREWKIRDSCEGIAAVEAVIQEMTLDRLRIRDSLLLEEGELKAHLRRTFELSLDLMLLAANSPLRHQQVPHLVEALAWCSVVRDLAEDLDLGLVNIPRQHWLQGTFADWLATEYHAAEMLLQAATSEIAVLKGQPGATLLRVFLTSIARYRRVPLAHYIGQVEARRWTFSHHGIET